MNYLIRKDLTNFESVQKRFNSLESNKGLKGKKLTATAKSMRLGRLWEFTNKGQVNPDELLEEARECINKTIELLKNYFVAKAEVTSHNTSHLATVYVRGFFSNNNIIFPTSFKLPKKQEIKIVQTDDKVPFYDYDETNKEIVFKDESTDKN